VVFDPSVKVDDVKIALEKLENYPCMPLLPEELLYYSYPETLKCPNP
jgi:hypothetical protein